jgi:hypothetical protein
MHTMSRKYIQPWRIALCCSWWQQGWQAAQEAGQGSRWKGGFCRRYSQSAREQLPQLLFSCCSCLATSQLLCGPGVALLHRSPPAAGGGATSWWPLVSTC